MCGNQDNSGISESILIEHWLQIAGTWWCFCTEAKGAVLKTRTGPDIFLFSSPVVSQGLEQALRHPYSGSSRFGTWLTCAFRRPPPPALQSRTLIPRLVMDSCLCPGHVLLPVAQSTEMVGGAPVSWGQHRALWLQTWPKQFCASWTISSCSTWAAIIAFGLNTQTRNTNCENSRE